MGGFGKEHMFKYLFVEESIDLYATSSSVKYTFVHTNTMRLFLFILWLRWWTR